LKWYNTSKPSICKWTNIKPVLFNIHKNISLRGNVNVELYGYVSKNIDNSDPFIDLSEVSKKTDYIEYTNISLLKSQIQKCVRQGKHCQAIRSSFHLMRLNFTEFCRRFPIICIEDSSIHLNLNIIYWFMMLGNTNILTKIHIRYILGLVLEISKSKNLDGDYSNINIDKFNLREEWFYLETINCKNKRNRLFGLLVRISYGGMNGDMRLFKRTYIKFKNINVEPYMICKHNSIKITRYLPLYDILPESIDFHCYPKILEKINKLFPEFDIQTIKKIIWENSSRINIRNNNVLNVDIRWDIIKSDFHKIGKQFIHNCN
jgi:hypothetical protein